jgi:hypothetical protein
LASVIPAFGFALLMCRWSVLVKGSVGLLCAFLFVPELRVLGYGQGTDAFSLLVLLGAFLLIFGFDKISPGVTLLLASIWIRSDNSILALLVLAYLAFRGVIPLWMSAVLAAIAFATPVAISHYGGSYGWKALYSHTFKYLENGSRRIRADFHRRRLSARLSQRPSNHDRPQPRGVPGSGSDRLQNGPGDARTASPVRGRLGSPLRNPPQL